MKNGKDKNAELAKTFFTDGLQYFQKGNYHEALGVWTTALALTPGRRSILINIALAQCKLKNWHAATLAINQILIINPSDTEAKKLRFEIEYIRQEIFGCRSTTPKEYVVSIDTKQAKIQFKEIKKAIESENYKSARQLLKSALASEPRNTTLAIQAIRLLEQSEGAQAAINYIESIQHIHSHSVDFLAECGLLFEISGDYLNADTWYNKALAINPLHLETKFRKALNYLRTGNYNEGWILYESRFGGNRPNARHLKLPRLTCLDDAIGANVLVWAEQGLGDTIQFSRYLFPLIKKGIQIHVEVPSELVEIIKDSFCIPTSSNFQNTDIFEFQIPLLSLPQLLWHEVQFCNHGIPFIHNKKNNVALLMPVNVNAMQIGLVCSGNPTHGNDKQRSIPLSQFANLQDQGNIYLIQKELRIEDRAYLVRNPTIHDLTSLISNFHDTASLIEQLDILISVDTAVAHLAGSMGKPVILILPEHSDWRWGRDENTTKWYPNTRIVRRRFGEKWKEELINLLTEIGKSNPQ